MGCSAAVSGFPANTAASSFLPNRQRALLRFFRRERRAKRQCRWGWGWGIKGFLAFLEQHCHQEENVTKPQAMWANKRRLLFSCSVLRHTRFPCPSLSPGVCSNSCPLCRWCHPIISSFVAPFSSYPQCFYNTRKKGMLWWHRKSRSHEWLTQKPNWR